jgi:hypothetical protein
LPAPSSLRSSLAALPPRRDVAKFVNAYPSIEVSYSIDEADYNASTPITVRVTLDREADEDEDEADQSVIAPFYPGKKLPNFWLILATGKTLQGIKKVTVQRELKVKLDVTLPAGDHEMKLYLMCVSPLTESPLPSLAEALTPAPSCPILLLQLRLVSRSGPDV